MRGVPVAVFSIAPQVAVESLLGEFASAACFGTAAVKKSDRLTRDLVEPIPYGKGRVQIAGEFAEAHGFSLDSSMYYGHSSGSVPLLRRVGIPVCANPSKRLETVARSEGWPVLHLT